MTSGPSRVVVLGNGGSGKSRLARLLAAAWSLEHVELDSLMFGLDWSFVERDVFRERVRVALASGRWVVEGMDREELAAQALPRAQLVVWLDVSRYVSARRLVWRTLRRLVLRVEVHGSRESWRDLVARQGFVWRTVAKHERRRDQFAALLQASDVGPDRVQRFGSPRAVRAWLREAVGPGEKVGL